MKYSSSFHSFLLLLSFFASHVFELQGDFSRPSSANYLNMYQPAESVRHLWAKESAHQTGSSLLKQCSTQCMFSSLALSAAEVTRDVTHKRFIVYPSRCGAILWCRSTAILCRDVNRTSYSFDMLQPRSIIYLTVKLT